MSMSDDGVDDGDDVRYARGQVERVRVDALDLAMIVALAMWRLTLAQMLRKLRDRLEHRREGDADDVGGVGVGGGVVAVGERV